MFHPWSVNSFQESGSLPLLCFDNQPTQFLLKFAFSLTHCLIDACISLSQNDKLIHINGLNRYVPVHAG